MSISSRLLGFPLVYDTYQSLIGAPRSHGLFVSEMLAPAPGDRVLDVGCGVGASLPFLPEDVSYVGIDISPAYIERAKARFGARGQFICADLSSIDATSLGKFDRAFSAGVLHHLSDAEVRSVVALIGRVLRPGGVFVTIDPCYVPDQSPIAKFLIDHDRGRYVRDPAGFKALLGDLGEVHHVVFHDLLRIPYTQVVMKVAVGA